MVYSYHLFTNLVTIRGEVNFEQNSPSENLTITVTNVTGLTEGNHGFHIHGNGNCKDPGSHFNPAKVSTVRYNQLKHGTKM